MMDGSFCALDLASKDRSLQNQYCIIKAQILTDYSFHFYYFCLKDKPLQSASALSSFDMEVDYLSVSSTRIIS